MRYDERGLVAARNPGCSEAITFRQPSLHSPEKWVNLALCEVEARATSALDRARLQGLRAQYERAGEGEKVSVGYEVVLEALDILADLGYPYYYGGDALLIWAQGAEVPARFQD